MERKVCAEWPEILCPAPGYALPVADNGKCERAIVASPGIAYRKEGTGGMVHAFNAVVSGARAFDLNFCEYTEQSMEREIEEVKPTIVWMQIQYAPSPVSPEFIEHIKRRYGVTVVLWDGDQHFEPHDRERQWFIELGRACDISLIKNTQHPYEYRDYGVRHPGYLGEGVDVELMHSYEHEATAPYPDVVMLANEYPNAQYAHRDGLLWALRQHYGQRFGLFGKGWADEMVAAPPVTDEAGAVIYSRAKASLSISIREDLPRYTSIRLWNILASGGVALIERFPDCEGMGLVDGVNCFVWEGLEELKNRIDWVCDQPRVMLEPMRRAARELALEHSWEMQVRKMLAMVNAVRT